MGREQNKKFEEAVASLLLGSVPELGGGLWQPGDSPDAIFAVRGERIGLEITSLHGSDSESGSRDVHLDSARALFLHLVESAIKAEGLPCLVSIDVWNPIVGGKRRAIAMSEEVIRLLKPRLTRIGEPYEWQRRGRDDGFPPEILGLELHWPAGLKTPVLLGSGGAFMISMDFAEPLRQVIARKAASFDRYLERCDRCWLAVVLPHYFEAEDDGRRSPAMAETYAAPFGRIFVVDLDRRRVWNVRTTDRE